jgi:hypothetical protein
MPTTQRAKHTQTSSRKRGGAARQDFGAALGASRSFEVANKPQGPFGVAAVLEEIQGRLVSRGGRPSDPGATIRRLVPLKTQVWRRLKAEAASLSRQGKRVSPAQLAAMLVEKSISELKAAQNPGERQKKAAG